MTVVTYEHIGEAHICMVREAHPEELSPEVA